MATTVLKVRGMDCADEAARLSEEVGSLTGVEELSFDVLNAKMTVVHQQDLVGVQDLVAAVGRTGMQAEPWDSSRPPAEQSIWDRYGRSVLTTLSGLCLAVGFASHVLIQGWPAAFGGVEGTAAPLVVRLFYSAAVVSGAWFVAPKAVHALQRLRPDMNLLMTVAVMGALLIGEFFEAGTVSFLFAMSLALESWSVGRARRAIAALMSIAPDTARLLTADGKEEVVEVQRVPIGSTVLVKPGDKFPLDGRVLKGDTSVNQAPITGESLPVPKTVGSEVYAGTINEDGAVEVMTTKVADDTTLARIIKMVGDAQSQRAPSEQWVERFARVYTPAVMGLAILVMVIPPIAFGGTWTRSFYDGLVLLVIACPCALVISTPVSIVAALTAAARNGVLVKGGPYIEAPARLVAIAIDKTGTLTEGKPEVQTVVPLAGHTERDVLSIAAAIERHSEHPLARAILKAASVAGIEVAAAENFQAVKGKGATAILGGRKVWLGSHRYLEERGQESPAMHEELERLANSGTSAVVVGEEDHVCGIIAVADQVRPQARAAVSALRAEGVRRVVMLTGDNRGTAEAVGQETGVDEVRAELLPEDKVHAVEELVREFGQVAMIGDGVNDAPAMARANLGIAMGAVGTDAALETADVALMTDDLSRIAWLIRHSRRTLRVIRQNIFASLAVKALFVILTLANLASLWAAIAADAGTSLLVIFNGLRLLHGRAREMNDTPLG